MNPFTTHPQQQGITYLDHWRFAMGTAYRLLNSVVAFAVHALFPFISIEPDLDLEATAAFIKERNEWIETAKGGGMGHSSLGFDDNEIGRTNSNTGNRRSWAANRRPRQPIHATLSGSRDTAATQNSRTAVFRAGTPQTSSRQIHFYPPR